MNHSSNIHGKKDDHVFFRGKPKRTIVRGEGIYFFDSEGNRYIDGSGGPMVVNIGHGVKEIAEVAAKQMEQLAYIHSMTHLTEPIQKLARKIISLTPRPLNKVFFVSGGSEGTETAIKLASQYHLEHGNPRKYKVIARWMSYHGNTLGALSASGFVYRRKKFSPLLLDFPHIPPAYCYRCWYHKEYPSCDLACAWELERAIKNAGADSVSAFIAEPVGGSAIGSVPAPEGYFEIIREICNKYNVLFIADEVQTGFGRTGKNFGIEHWNAVPDLIICAKGLSSGYAPIGAVITTDEVQTTFNKEGFRHGFTFGGIPVSCAIGFAVLEYMTKHDLIARAAEMGKLLLEKLETLREHPSVGDVRGKGLLTGIEFVNNKETKEPFDPSTNFCTKLQEITLKNGLSIYPIHAFLDGIRGDHIQVSPPYIVTTSQLDEIVTILDRSLDEIEDLV